MSIQTNTTQQQEVTVSNQHSEKEVKQHLNGSMLHL